MAELILTHEGKEIGSWQLGDEPFTVGSSPVAKILVESPNVAPRHCVIAEMDGQYIISDLGSGFGTVVNGEKIVQAALMPGDSIELGDYRLIFIWRSKHSDAAGPGVGSFDPMRTVDDRQANLAGEHWVLSVTGGGTEEAIALTGPVLVIGSAEGCDLRLQHRKVLPNHAAVVADADGIRLLNICRNKKLAVNDRVVEKRTSLAAGDIVAIGPYTLTVLKMA